jgi:diguanylate cyclase (GGDEF)-like protein/PAS domain S-box-containing protein
MLGFQRETLTLIYENAPLPIHIIDRDGVICWTNRLWLKTLGYENADVIGVRFVDLVAANSKELVLSTLETMVADGGPVEQDVKINNKDGSETDFSITSASLDDSKAFHYAQCILLNVSKSKVIEKELIKISMNDHLTGHYNRKKIISVIETEIARVDRYGGELSMLMIDINHMSEIINRFGHAIGDRAVLKVSETVKKYKRTPDSVGRYAGDKFIIVLPETSTEGALVYAERLAYEIKLPISEEQRITLTLSIGVSEFNEDVTGADEMINNTYSALQRGKVEGKSTVSMFGD